ncbi:MAG: M48 family metalloprotease [Thermoplasmata archaeon]
MDLPPVGLLAIPAVVWLCVGGAVLWALRRGAPPVWIHRLAALFVGLWALLATTAAVWIVLNGGWNAVEGLASHPPSIFSDGSAMAWVLGGVGATGLLGAAFLLTQLVGRGFLRLYRPQPIPWPPSLAPAAKDIRLLEVDLPRPDAFAYTLMHHVPKVGIVRQEFVLIARSLRERLTPEEETAALAHELAHIRDLDGRYLVFLRTFSQLMRWDPILGSIAGSLSQQEELRADRLAVDTTGNPRALARALYKALRSDSPRSSSPGLVPLPRGRPGFLGQGKGRRGERLVRERIDRLLRWAENGGPEGGAPTP